MNAIIFSTYNSRIPYTSSLIDFAGFLDPSVSKIRKIAGAILVGVCIFATLLMDSVYNIGYEIKHLLIPQPKSETISFPKIDKKKWLSTMHVQHYLITAAIAALTTMWLFRNSSSPEPEPCSWFAILLTMTAVGGTVFGSYSIWKWWKTSNNRWIEFKSFTQNGCYYISDTTAVFATVIGIVSGNHQLLNNANSLWTSSRIRHLENENARIQQQQQQAQQSH